MLYTDKYYTPMVLAKNMFNKYGWEIVSTILSTDKKSRSDNDITFLKLSNVARNGLQWGWYHVAAIKAKNPTVKVYHIQYTTWSNKNQVWFLNLNEVGYTDVLTVKINIKKKNKQ